MLLTVFPEKYVVQFCKVAEAGAGARAAWPRLHSPPKRRRERLKILGSCDGMVVISLDNTKKIFVWNPLTGDYSKLPEPGCLRHHRPDHDRLFCGFGYDSWSEDYKLVVAMPDLDQMLSAFDAEVFSMRGNTWSMVENPPYVHKAAAASARQCAFVGGAFHWRVASNHELIGDEVAAFDLKTEKFKGVGIKQGCYVYAVGLGVFEGKLCMVNNYVTTRPSEVWVMEEYGNVDSWALLFTLRANYFIFDPLYISNTNIIYASGYNARYQLASCPTTPPPAAAATATAGEGNDPQLLYDRPYSSHGHRKGQEFEAIAFAESLVSPSFYYKGQCHSVHTHKSLLGRTLRSLLCSSID